MSDKKIYAVTRASVASECITPGKKYETSEGASPRSFTIRSDTGGKLFCLWRGCAHLDGGSWQRVEESSDQCATSAPNPETSETR